MQTPQTDYLQANSGRTLRANAKQLQNIDGEKDMQLFHSLSAVLQYESKYPGQTVSNEKELNGNMVLLAMCYYTHNVLLQKLHNQSHLALRVDPTGHSVYLLMIYRGIVSVVRAKGIGSHSLKYSIDMVLNAMMC